MKTRELFENLVKCPLCGKEVKPLGLASHVSRIHNADKVKWVNREKMGWSKGQTKQTSQSVAAIASKNQGREFPNRPTHSDLTKTQISAAMVKAHQDGRAHNIGSSRWNNEPSYPEKFFAEVIKNEFTDKGYTREYPLGRFSIDFAWPHSKKAIEIDGDQHDRFEKQRESDARKDKALADAGWQVLRVKWKQMFANTKDEILRCKKFIDG